MIGSQWRHDAACIDVPVGLFYPHPDSSRHPVWRHGARICDRCPVRACCLDYAVRNREKDGIWGGLQPDERQALHARRRHAGAQALDRVRQLVEAAP